MKTVLDRKKLEYLKERAGYDSDAELLKAAGLGLNTLSRVVGGEGDVKISTLDRLAGTLKCSPIDLLVVRDAPEPFFYALVVPLN